MGVLLLGMVVLLGLATELGVHDRVVAEGWAPAGSPSRGGHAGGRARGRAAPARGRRGAGSRRLGTARVRPRLAPPAHAALGGAAPLLLLGVFAPSLAAGWADLVRGWTGDAWILDDLLTLAPPLLATVAMDAASWPLVRRFREAVILRRADAGEPIHPVPGRWAYAVGRLRGGPGLLGVPLLLILGWTQGFDALLAAAWSARLVANARIGVGRRNRRRRLAGDGRTLAAALGPRAADRPDAGRPAA